MRFNLEISFLSDWHVGGGLGDGYLADATLVREATGWPYLPGRAVKGALREGARRLGLAREDLAEWEVNLFGSLTNGEGLNRPGRLQVGNGRLPGDLERLLASESGADRLNYVRDMTILRRQTAVTEAGAAKPGTLRALECGAPGLFFTAEIQVDRQGLPAPEDWLRQYFSAVCGLVKSLGGQRSRGLGRCRFKPDFEAEGQTIVAPAILKRL
ncbi:MAG: RAMP superfamily CRISPR-associated protein [Candidatus Adiutrix sp.]|nr:RAMP superfamily CRISPR-associated protein [Candidatus Adiutrix sp.]